MKKLSIILLALAFALSFAVPAFAIHIGSEGTSAGALGISGKYQFDGEIDDDDAGKDEYYDDDLELVMRYMTGPVTAVIDWEISDRNPLQSHTNDITLIDNYWIEWAATDALTFKAGEYALGFGRKLVLYNEGGSGWTISYALDALDVSLSSGKDVDTTDVNGDDADATDNMILVKVKEAGPFSKLDIVYMMSQVEEGVLPADQDDNYTGVDLAIPLGPVDLAVEFGSLGGDVAEGSIFVVEVGLDELVGFGLNVNMIQSSDDFDPSPFNGGDDYTPLSVLMDEVNEPQVDITAIWVELGYDVNDQLSLSAAATVSAENDAGDAYGSEVDVGMAYQINDNVVYKASYASWSEDDFPGNGDRSELWHRIQFTF